MKNNFTSDIKYYQNIEKKKESKKEKETKLIDNTLKTIEEFCKEHKDLDINLLVTKLISKKLVTKGNLNINQLRSSTYNLVKDILEDLCQ